MAQDHSQDSHTLHPHADAAEHTHPVRDDGMSVLSSGVGQRLIVATAAAAALWLAVAWALS